MGVAVDLLVDAGVVETTNVALVKLVDNEDT